MLLRARDLDVINYNRYQNLFRKYSSRGWRTNEPFGEVLKISNPSLLKSATKKLIEEKNWNGALPYNAQTKPVERDFLKIKEILSKHFIGYRGGNVVERPQKLAKEIKSGKIMKFEDFKLLFDKYILDILNKRPSQGKTLNGLCPDELFYSEFKEKITTTKNALKLFCMRTSKDFTIRRNGIKDTTLGITYWADWMISKMGMRVYLRRDIEDYKEAWAFRCDNDEFIGTVNAVKAVAALHADKVSKEEFKEAFGKELPQISFNPNVNRQKYTGSIPYAGMFFPSYYSTSIYFPLNANYELDIWLKNRTYTKKVKKEYDTTKFEEKAQFISLTTLTASTYINIICLDQKVLQQEELVKIRKEILDLITINFEYGLNSSIDVTDAEQRYVESMTELENLKQNRSVLLNQLAVLTGDSSENSSEILRNSFDALHIPDNLPKTVSTEIINSRPDILKAEAELEAAALDVKLARKAFLPSLNLTGFLGFNAYTMSKMFEWRSFVINGAAGLAQNLFTGGQLKARLRAKKYNYDAMLNAYQKTILTSVQEVNDSLVNVKSDEIKYTNYIKRTKLEKSKYNNINYKYEKGAISYLDALKFKENFFILEKDRTQSKADYLISALSLYKAVGGNF